MAPLSLIVGQFDLTPFVRVTPGEGFDPMSTDLLQPGFGDSGGEGAPLLSEQINNREMVFPVHLNPAKLNRQPVPQDGTFTNWTSVVTAGGTINTALESVQQTDGTWRLHIKWTDAADATSRSVEVRGPDALRAVQVTPGEVVKATATINILDGVAETSVWGVLIRYLDAAGALLSSTSGTTLPGSGTTGVQELIPLTDTVPASAAFMTISVRALNINTPSEVIEFEVISTGAYRLQSTKNDLHDLITNIDSILSNIADLGSQVIWQDEGATARTYYSALYGRFEPDFNFRRSQRLWASGVIRVWTRPFGNSGAYRNIGAAAATGPGAALAVVAGTVGGDINSDLRVVVSAGSFPYGDGRINGFSIVPSGYAWDIPVGSMVPDANATFVADPTGMGSQSIMDWLGDTPTVIHNLVRVGLSPASMYAGRNRLIGIVQGGGQQFSAYQERVRLGVGVASSSRDLGHGVVDLGVLSVTPFPGQATVTVDIKTFQDSYTFDYDADDSDDTFGGGWRRPAINRLLVLPEDSTVLMVDTARRLVAWDNFEQDRYPDASALIQADALGNLYTNTLGLGTAATGSFAVLSTGHAIINNTKTNDSLAWLGVGHDVLAEMEVALAFTLRTNAASYGVFVGKGNVALTDSNTGGQVYVQTANASRGSLSILGEPFNVAASVGMNTTMPSGAILRARWVGPRVDAIVRNLAGTILATVGAANASFSNFDRPAQTTFGVIGSSTALTSIVGWLTQGVPSQARNARDKIVFDSGSQVAYLLSSASVFQRDLTSYIRGRIPKLSPSMVHRVVGLNLPMGGGEFAADAVDVDVSVLERWRYAR